MDERDARNDESNEDGQERAPQTWKERHGASVMATVVMLILVLVVAFQMNC
jgi:hypothetical protein